MWNGSKRENTVFFKCYGPVLDRVVKMNSQSTEHTLMLKKMILLKAFWMTIHVQLVSTFVAH